MRSGAKWRLHLCREAIMPMTPEERFPSQAAFKQKEKILSLFTLRDLKVKCSYSCKWPRWKVPTHARENLKIPQILQNISTSSICGGGIYTGSSACTTSWLILPFSFKEQVKFAWQRLKKQDSSKSGCVDYSLGERKRRKLSRAPWAQKESSKCSGHVLIEGYF